MDGPCWTPGIQAREAEWEDLTLAGRGKCAPAGLGLERHVQIFGRPPILAAADRGFASAANEQAAREQGVRRVVLPHPGRTTPARRRYQRQRWFRRGQRWRVGSEGRISVLKHRHGLKRSRYHGLAGVERWVGLGVIANNLLTLARATPRKRSS